MSPPPPCTSPTVPAALAWVEPLLVRGSAVQHQLLLFPGVATRGPPTLAEASLCVDGLSPRFSGSSVCLPVASPNTSISENFIQAPVATYWPTCKWDSSHVFVSKSHLSHSKKA